MRIICGTDYNLVKKIMQQKKNLKKKSAVSEAALIPIFGHLHEPSRRGGKLSLTFLFELDGL